MNTPNRRNAILEAARAEFATHGYFGARIERIAAEAKANKQLIFHYFGSKDGLYSAAVAAALSGAPPMTEEPSPPPDALKRHVSALTEWLIKTPGAALAISECRPGRDVPAGAVSQVAGWMESQERHLSALLDDGQRKGHFRDDIDVQAIVALSLGSAIGLVLSGSDASFESRISTDYPSIVARAVADQCVWR